MNQEKLLLHQQDACVIECVNFMYISEGNKYSSYCIYQNFKEYVNDRSLSDHQPSVNSQLTDHSKELTDCWSTAGNSIWQGWCSGESTRLPPMWPGFDSRSRRHMWVEFVVGSSSLLRGFFSGYSGFPLSIKTNISKFQFDLDVGP